MAMGLPSEDGDNARRMSATDREPDVTESSDLNTQNYLEQFQSSCNETMLLLQSLECRTNNNGLKRKKPPRRDSNWSDCSVTAQRSKSKRKTPVKPRKSKIAKEIDDTITRSYDYENDDTLVEDTLIASPPSPFACLQTELTELEITSKYNTKTCYICKNVCYCLTLQSLRKPKKSLSSALLASLRNLTLPDLDSIDGFDKHTILMHSKKPENIKNYEKENKSAVEESPVSYVLSDDSLGSYNLSEDEEALLRSDDENNTTSKTNLQQKSKSYKLSDIDSINNFDRIPTNVHDKPLGESEDNIRYKHCENEGSDFSETANFAFSNLSDEDLDLDDSRNSFDVDNVEDTLVASDSEVHTPMKMPILSNVRSLRDWDDYPSDGGEEIDETSHNREELENLTSNEPEASNDVDGSTNLLSEGNNAEASVQDTQKDDSNNPQNIEADESLNIALSPNEIQQHSSQDKDNLHNDDIPGIEVSQSQDYKSEALENISISPDIFQNESSQIEDVRESHHRDNPVIKRSEPHDIKSDESDTFKQQTSQNGDFDDKRDDYCSEIKQSDQELHSHKANESEQQSKINGNLIETRDIMCNSDNDKQQELKSDELKNLHMSPDNLHAQSSQNGYQVDTHGLCNSNEAAITHLELQDFKPDEPLNIPVSLISQSNHNANNHHKDTKRDTFSSNVPSCSCMPFACPHNKAKIIDEINLISSDDEDYSQNKTSNPGTSKVEVSNEDKLLNVRKSDEDVDLLSQIKAETITSQHFDRKRRKTEHSPEHHSPRKKFKKHKKVNIKYNDASSDGSAALPLSQIKTKSSNFLVKDSDSDSDFDNTQNVRKKIKNKIGENKKTTPNIKSSQTSSQGRKERNVHFAKNTKRKDTTVTNSSFEAGPSNEMSNLNRRTTQKDLTQTVNKSSRKKESQEPKECCVKLTMLHTSENPIGQMDSGKPEPKEKRGRGRPRKRKPTEQTESPSQVLVNTDYVPITKKPKPSEGDSRASFWALEDDLSSSD